MAVEISSGQKPATRVAVANSRDSSDIQTMDLLPGERVITELDSDGENYFQLTGSRVILHGGSRPEGRAVYASVHLNDISSVQISRRPRARRSAAWGVVGLFSAVGVWQVTPDSMIGVGSAIAVALISLVLMADYWIRPAGVHLEFHTVGGKIEGQIGGKVSNALAFARAVEDERRRLVPSRANRPFRKYPSG